MFEGLELGVWGFGVGVWLICPLITWAPRTATWGEDEAVGHLSVYVTASQRPAVETDDDYCALIWIPYNYYIRLRHTQFIGIQNNSGTDGNQIYEFKNDDMEKWSKSYKISRGN